MYKRKHTFSMVKAVVWLILLTIGSAVGVIKLFKLDSQGKLLAPIVMSFEVNKEQIGNGKDTSRETKQLLSKVTEIFREATGNYSLYVYRIEEEVGYGINEDRQLTAASMMKVPIMTATEKAISQGEMSLETEYVLKSGDKRSGSGPIEYYPSGTRLTIEEILTEMGKKSDNTAPVILLNLLGKGKVEEEVKVLGMTDSSFEENRASAVDLARMWVSIYKGQGLTAEQRDEVWEWLSDSIYEERIPAGLPRNTKVIHKVGTGDGVWADSGIVIPGDEAADTKPFVLVVMNEQAKQEEAMDIVPKVAELVWRHETGGKL